MPEFTTPSICLVTGATRGIGRATALGLAGPTRRVVLLVRDVAAGARVAEEVDAIAGHAATDVIELDLASQRSIRKAATEVEQRYDRIDVLVNNAAIVTRTRTLTEDGVELQFAVNHIGYFLLTTLLLERLVESAPARVVNVASDAHYRGSIDLNDLNRDRGYSAFGAYCQSKLANVLFTRELSRRVAAAGVTANCLHPGVVGTGLLATLSRLPRAVVPLLFKSPERGAQTSLYLATSPAVAGTTGEYFRDEEAVRPSRTAQDDVLARDLWQRSEDLVKASGP